MKVNNPVKILLVDDLPENLFALELILSNKNYLCIKANSGNEALKILLHQQDFALILMDVQMPEMDGFETIELIREVETLKHIPIIFLTASMDNSNQIYKGYQTGAVDYMIKPLNPEILKAKVAAIADIYLKTNELLVQNKEKEKRAAELIIANKELAFQNEEKEKRAAELIIANKELAFQNEEKEKRAAELIIANKELAFQNEEKEKRAAELIIANKELVFHNEEKEKRAAELIIANKELVFQNEEKEKRAAELIIANEELVFQNEEKEKRAAELIIANEELVFQNEEKEKRAAELIIANKELAFQNEEKEKRAAELIIANKELIFENEEKGKRAAELNIANKELVFQNEEKEKRAAELIIANKELAFQNYEKEKRAAELIIANKELAFQNEEKEKRAAELIIANKELAFQNEEKEKRAAELIIANKELAFQNEEKEKRAAELIIAKEKAEESDRLKTAFLHNISHEIRTPMNAIIGFSGFLKDPELSTEKRNNFADIVIKSSEQLLSIITDIISIATIEAGQQKIYEKEINLNSNIQLLYSQYITKANNLGIKLDFNTTLPNNEAFIRTDGTKLLEILSNLIGNSLKFIKLGSVEFGYHLKENMLEFYVIDTGIGIPQEMQNEIFDRFRQVESTLARDYGGSGLGLSISKAQVELLGGKIWLNSELGKGTTFYFTIPYHNGTENNSSKKQLEAINVKVQKTKTLLIVEDEETNFLLLKEFLTAAKITILWAENGLQAIELFKENPHIDLILMDIKMPKMNGYEATKIIRALNPQIPVIAQTAYSTESDKNKGLQFGFNDFLSKPIEKHLFLTKINDFLK